MITVIAAIYYSNEAGQYVTLIVLSCAGDYQCYNGGSTALVALELLELYKLY